MQLSAELPVRKVDNVELVIDNVRKQYKFGDLENLRGKLVRVVDVFRKGNVPLSPLGNSLVNDEIFNKSFLVLAINGKEDVNRIPLTVLNPMDNFGRRILFSDLEVNWPKSYIEVGNMDNLTVGTSFFLNVYYSDKPSK